MTQLHKQPHTAGLTNGNLKPSISSAIPAALLRASPNAALVIGMGHTAGTCIQGRDTLRDFRQAYLRQNLSSFERKEDTWPATMTENGALSVPAEVRVLPTHSQPAPRGAAELWERTRCSWMARSSVGYIHTWLALSVRKASCTRQLQPDCAARRNENMEKNKAQPRKDISYHWFHFLTLFDLHGT